MNKRKIVNDPVFGFITVPCDLIYDLMQHPMVHRLTRIKQLGLTCYVYPGAQHTRFQHSLGALFLMTEAIKTLQNKGNDITPEEAEAVYAAIFLHDVGHGPFSHTLEDFFYKNISHEDIGIAIIEKLNEELNGKLNLTIEILKNSYLKKFLHELVSGQLDMDRLDYLRRDSFFTGVSEGNIGSARIIKMLNIKDGKLVVEAKGIYSIENFLMSRRLMYWQVYLHHTSVAAEQVLIQILKRAKQLTANGVELFCSPALRYFLLPNTSSPDTLIMNYAQLDDSDLLSAIKVWMGHEDKVLSTLCKGLINRVLFKTRVLQEPLTDEEKQALDKKYSEALAIPLHEAQYFYEEHISTSKTYSNHGTKIGILFNDGSIRDIAEASEILDMKTLTQKPEKRYLLTFPLG